MKSVTGKVEAFDIEIILTEDGKPIGTIVSWFTPRLVGLPTGTIVFKTESIFK